MESLWHDIRIAARRLARNRGFTAIAVVTLALGIGANSAIFSLVDAVLLRPLPFKDQDRLVSVYERRNGQGQDNVSAHEFVAWREARHVFQDAAMYRGDGMTLTGRGDATAVNLLRVTTNFLTYLACAPRLVAALSAGRMRVAPIVWLCSATDTGSAGSMPIPPLSAATSSSTTRAIVWSA